MTDKSHLKYQSTEELIETISRDLPRVRVKSILELTLQNLLTLTLLGGGFIAMLRFNDTISLEFQSLSFSTSSCATVLGLFLGSYCLAKLSRPGQKLSDLGMTAFVFSAALNFAIQCLRIMNAEHLSQLTLDNGWKCLTLTCLVAVSTLATMIYLLRQQAPVLKWKVTLTLLLVSISLGTLILQFHCPNTQPLHELLWHILLPLAAVSGLTRLASRESLNW